VEIFLRPINGDEIRKNDLCGTISNCIVPSWLIEVYLTMPNPKILEIVHVVTGREVT
jgi:hypothetical protein